MRYVPVQNLIPGLVLGKDILSSSDSILVASGTELTDGLISSIQRLGVEGIQVETPKDLALDVEVDKIVSPEVQRRAVYDYKAIVTNHKATSSIGNLAKESSAIKFNLNSIIEQVLAKSTSMINELEEYSAEEYQYAHAVNTCILAVGLGAALGFEYETLTSLGYGAMFCNIGMQFVPREILNKKGPLTRDEKAIVQRHCKQGSEYVRKTMILPVSCNSIILDHHEAYGGEEYGGYPEGRKGEHISKLARIVSICDVYDALTNKTPYREAYSPSDALEFIMGGSGTKFDPKYVDMFARKIAPFPVGSTVQLSNGALAKVYDCKVSSLRPKVKVYFYDGRLLDTAISIDLSSPNHFNLTIVSLISLG